MNIEKLLQSVKDGHITIDEAKNHLKTVDDLGYAKVDLHRTHRTGFPEVIYAEGKTIDQVVAIFSRLMSTSDRALATRVSKELAEAVLSQLPTLTYNPVARTLTWFKEEEREMKPGYVAIVCAGTTDVPVAEEAAITAECFDAKVERIYDVGVAGIHRLFAHLPTIQNASAIVVVAGMEGALASVVGGLVSKPVVAVPTSIGYGANFKGVSALLTMLNSCATGVTVVNIDNGFGAGYFAGLMIQNLS
jgi:NCAIR mutase (PurE)-related protein